MVKKTHLRELKLGRKKTRQKENLIERKLDRKKTLSALPRA